MTRARNDRRAIAAAQDQVSAMLFFALPPPGKRRRGPKQLRYALDSAIRGLVHLAGILEVGHGERMVCEACRRPIGPGRPYVSGDDGDFHAGCLGVPAARCARTPTRREQRAELAKRVAEARVYLKRRGFSA